MSISAALCQSEKDAQSSELLFDAQQDATCAGLDARTLPLNIHPAGVPHCRDLHKRRLARLSEILEMCLSTFDKAISVRSIGRTKLHNVPTASLDDPNTFKRAAIRPVS